MLKKWQHTAAIFMAMLILVASVGVPVNEHICLSDNFYELSILPIEKCDSKPMVKHGCCTGAKSGNCSAPAGKSVVSKATNPCCSYNSAYVALETDLFAPQTNGDSLLQNPVSTALPAFLVVLQSLMPHFEGIGVTSGYLIPPPPLLPASGNMACALLQVFIC